MLRGEIRLVDLDPVRGAEANKVRPAILVSNDDANEIAARRGAGVLTVVPATSNVDRILPFQTFLPAEATGLRHDSKAQAEQVRSVAIERIGREGSGGCRPTSCATSTTPCASTCGCEARRPRPFRQAGVTHRRSAHSRCCTRLTTLPAGSRTKKRRTPHSSSVSGWTISYPRRTASA